MSDDFVSDDALIDEWVSKAWDKSRGIHTTDYNNHAVFVQGPVEQVGQAVTENYPHSKWLRDVLGRDIVLGQEGFFIFRLKGHSWTELLHHYTRQSVLNHGYIQRLSHSLPTRVISYSVSDTAGGISYTLYEQGAVLEKFEGMEGIEEETRFESKIRDIAAEEIENVWAFAYEFFVEQDALEPGIEPGYFLTDYYSISREIRPGQPVKIHNPGKILNVGHGKEGISVPDLERVDYVVLAE